MPIFEYNGTKYNVQDQHISDFASEYPEATTIAEQDGKKYRIKSADYQSFQSEFGGAKPKVNDPESPMSVGQIQEDELQANRQAFEDDHNGEYVEGFGQGFKQGWKGMKEGMRYLAGETANLVTGTSRDDKAALDALNERVKQGEQVSEERAPWLNRMLDKWVASNPALPPAWRDAAESREEQDKVNKLINQALEDAGGDIDQARRILAKQWIHDETWGDRVMEDASKEMGELKPTRGFGAWAGNLVPQMIPSAAAVAASVITKNPKFASLIGKVGMGAMTAATAGQSMKEARDAGASTSDVWTAGIVDGVIEYATEKIPLDRYTRRLFGNTKAKMGAELAEAVADGDSPARKELETLLSKANKNLGGKLLNEKNAKDLAEDMLAEGSSEFLAEAMQTITPMLYENPEDYPTIMEVVNNGFEGFKAGIFMGSVLGGASKAAEHNMQRSRRKAQGFVDVAQVKGDDGVSDIAEIVGRNEENGNLIILQDGETSEIKPDQIEQNYRFSFEEFERGVLQSQADESYDNGYSLETPQELNDAKNMLEEQADRIRALYALDADADVDDFLGDDPIEGIILSIQAGASEDEQQAKLDYLNAKATYDGMIQRVRDDIDSQVEANNSQLDGLANKATGMVSPATLKLDDKAVYIVGGNVVLNDDGSVNIGKSDKAILIKDANTGHVEMIAPSAILSMGQQQELETMKSAQAQAIADAYATKKSNEIDGVLPFAQGDTYTIMDDQGTQHVVKIVADNGDGTVSFTMDQEVEPTVAQKEYVQQMSDAFNKQRAAAVAEQKKAQEVAQQEAQVAEEAPQSVLEQIPTNENGEQVFEQAPAETTWAALIEMNEGDVSEAADTAQQMLKVSQKELEKATKEKAGVGTSVAEIQKIKAERKAKIDALQNRVNYWTNVLSLNTPTQEVEQTEQIAEEPMANGVEENPIVEEEIAPIIEEAQVAEPIVEAEEVIEPIVEQSRPKVKNISKKEDARRQPLRERVAEWVDKLGVPVVVMETFSDIENVDAKREIRKGGRIAGWYEPSTGAVMLYMPHLADMSEIDKTITHEIVAHKGLAHMLGKNKHNALLDRVWDMMSEDAKAKYINYPNVNGNTRRAADEYIAFLSEGVNLTELDQSAWDKIVGFVRELLAEVGINMQLTDADIADLIRLSYTNLVRENQKAKETKGADDINEQEGQALFSIRTYEESGRENLQKFLKGQVKKKRITKADAEAIEATMEQMYETAVEYKDKFAPFGAWSEAEVVKGKDGQPVFSVVKKNGEYAMNLDFSTVCKKRRTLDAVFSEMIDRGLIDMIPMEGEQIAEINNIIRDYGFETACALCFVDAKRFRVAQVADKFCDMWNPMTKISDEELQGVINEYGKKVVRGKIAKHLIDHPEDRVELGRENFIESNGFEQMEINHPEILSLYKQAQGTSLAKIPFGDVQYLNEIEGNSWTPEAAYAVGGVRLQSFSDYVPRMFFDYMQMTAGLASKKLPVHAYTKEPLFAKQFGLTGMKINLSLVPKVVEGGVAAGLDADGNYAWMEGETFPFEEAMALQNAEGYRENCGTIAVGVSDEHIEKMLDDPNIRMIIPYHKSGLNPLVAKKNRIAEFTDYTNVQNTRSANGTKLEKEDLKDMPDFNSLMHNEGMDARQAAQAYLDWCDSKGFIPKFNKFRGHQNYYKLLEDFTTIVPNAEGVETTYPQREVTMTFPTEESAFGSIESLIREGLEEDAILEGKRDEKLGEIVDTIEKEMVRFRFIGQQGAANLDKAEEATTRLDDLAVARQMESEGKDAKSIKMATGWERGADDKWRYEVNDFKLVSPEKWVPHFYGSLRLEDAIEDPNGLFEEYPELKAVKIKRDRRKKTGGSYDVSKKMITLNLDNITNAIAVLYNPTAYRMTKEAAQELYSSVSSTLHGTLSHEVQHAIQHIEGFATGANPKMTSDEEKTRELNKRLQATNDKAKEYNSLSAEERRTDFGRELRDSILRERKAVKRLMKQQQIGTDGYKRVAGEVEARNVDRRRNMSMGERLASLASETEDVARKDQIFIFNALADANQKAQFRVAPEMDAQYLSLVEEGNLEEAQKMVDAAANAAGYNADESWKKAHRAPRKSEDNVNPFNTEELVPADYWAHPEWYTQIRHYQTDRESYFNMLPAINKYKRLVAEGKQDEADKVTVTMYRGVDKRANKKESTFRNGDWITPSRSYALLSAPEGNARVISQDVLLKDIWWDGNSINEWGYDDGANYVYQDTKNNRKSADAVTYDDNGNVIPLSKRFNKRSEDVRFRAVEPAPTFYSNAEAAVRSIKQEKATPEQWLKMVEKNGGLKAGEDKWIGLSDWLKASDKKTLTKQEVLDYINENQIQIEETTYSSNNAVETTPEFKALQEEFKQIAKGYEDEARRNLDEYEAKLAKKYNLPENYFDTTVLNSDESKAHSSLSRITAEEIYNAAWLDMVDRYGDDFEIAFWRGYDEIRVDNAEAAGILLGLPIDRPIYHLREDYTTKGLEGNREIALTVSTIEPWNENDEIHFGDAGDGRAIAWIRFGETTDEDGKRVLVIDEIQSKRHQEGREKGYRPSDVDKYLKDNNVEVIETGEFYEFYRDGELDRRFSKGLLRYKVDAAKNLYVAGYEKSNIPEAPFEKNWAELAMKRMLRYAAENGFDKVAWTKGDQQAERYDLSKSVERIDAEDNNVEEASDGTPIAKNITIRTSNQPIHLYVDANGIIRGGQYANHQLSEVVGKGIAEKLMQKGNVSLSGDGLRIGGEGMKGFYDQMLPSFMNKYGKKWGVKVQDVTLPNVEEVGHTMHSVDVTESMRESVMQGQPMFRAVDTSFAHAYDEVFAELESEYQALDKNNEQDLKAFRTKKRELVQEYLNHMSDNLAMPTAPFVFDASNIDSVKNAYEVLPIELQETISLEEFATEVSELLGFYTPNTAITMFNVAKDDSLNRPRKWLGALVHENSHKVVEGLRISDLDKEALWDFCKETAPKISKKIEADYDTDAERGEEYLAYTIQTRAEYERLEDLLIECIMGEKTAQDVILSFKDLVFLRDEIITKILNTFRDGYRKARRGGSSTTGGDAQTRHIEGSDKGLGRGYQRDLSRDNGRRRDLTALRESATELASQLNTPLRIVEDVNTITDNNAKLQDRKRNAKGWFDRKANEVVVVLPNATSVEDVRETIFHEVVGHKGLRELVGKERYDAFLEKVYRGASETIRERIARRAAKLGWDFHLATDEYLADLAEDGFEDRENRNFFEVVRDLFLDMLSKAKIALGYNISDNDMRYMLWRTYQMQRSKGAMGIAEDMVMQQKLGVGNFAPSNTRLRVAAEQGGLSKRVSDIMEEYDDSEEIFTIGDVADRIEELLNEYDGNESTTALENILNDYRDAQSEANRYGHRWDSGGEDEFEEALRLYGAQPTRFRATEGVYLKAPNGKDTNLTPEQWEMVRTKEFKNWFGDWEKAARIEKLRKSEPIAIPENAHEGKYELNQASAEKYIKDNLRSEYRIDDTGEVVKLTNRSAKKLLSHSYNSKAHLQSIVAIPEMIRNAVFIDEAIADKDNARFDSYRYYVCGVKIGGEDYTARITIGVKDGAFYYDHSLTEIEKGNLIEIAQGFTPNGGRTLPSYALSKDTRIIPLLQTDSSKILDANGEPLVVWHGGEFATDEFVANGAMHFGTKTAALQRILDNTWGYGNWEVAKNEDGTWGWSYTDPDDSGYDKRSEGSFARPLDAMEDAVTTAAPNAVVRPYFLNIRNLERTEDQNSDWEDIIAESKEDGHDGIIYRNEYEGNGEDSYIAFSPEQIKLADGSNTTFDPTDDDVRFRAVSPSEISTNGIMQGIRNEYDKLVKTSAYQSREASQDSMLSLRRFMEMTAKAYGIPMEQIKDWENAYQSENALSSKNEAQIEEFDRLYGAPLIQTVQELRKKGYTYEQIDDYLQIKHGIERNREMAVRAAISDEEGRMDKEKLEKWNSAKERVSNDQSLDSWEKMQRALDKSAGDIIYSAYLDKIFQEAGKKEREAIKSLANKKYKGDINRATEEFFDTFRSKGFRNFAASVYRDYSGLTAMYPAEKKIEDAVEKGYAEVNDFEKNVGQNLINELWRRIRAANMQTLNKTYRTSLISKETFDSISSMYSYYVPLRGFAETTSDEVYGYLNNEPMAFNAPIRKARGRSSKADQVLPNVLSAAHSAILQGNRNMMKNHFLNFVQHYPTDLISVQNMWVEYDKAKKQWVAKFPDLEDTDTPEEVAAKTQAFEEKMKGLKEKYPNEYKQVTQKIDVPYIVQKQHLKQHQIVVKRNGVDVVLTVNGSPRLAIVMNGVGNDSKMLGKVGNWVSARTRYLSGIYTSYNPDFVVSNFIRDAIYTHLTVWLKESPAYAARFNKNKVITCNPIKMRRLILKYSTGTLDMSNEVEKAFFDFVMNGGETGYAKLASIEQLKKDIGHMIEPTMWDNVKALGKKLTFLNRTAESSARFAAFLTSRQMGRSVARSVADAKEISVNFNKKGAGALFMDAKDQTWVGKKVAGSIGFAIPMYAFFNAGMQGLNNFLRIYKHAPLKTTALTTGLFLLGALVASMLEGDDEEEYYALPESVRRQNIVFRAGDNSWVKIPLPIEMRAIYGLGEMFTSIAKGKEDLSDHGIAYKMAEQLSQVLPINVLEGKGGLGTLVPTLAAPIVETMSNEDWAGLPIYRDDIYKGDSDIPEYLRVYQRTGKGYVAVSKALNDITGGDNRERGALGFVNPAVIEHIVDGYLGGPAQFMNKVVSSAEMAFGDKEFDLRGVPFANRLLMSNNTTMSRKTVNNYYYRHKEEAERIDRLVKNYQKDMNDPTKTDEERAYAAAKAQEKRDSEEWRKAQEFLRRTSAVDDIEKQFKEAPEGTSDEVVYEVKDFANEVYKKNDK